MSVSKLRSMRVLVAAALVAALGFAFTPRALGEGGGAGADAGAPSVGAGTGAAAPGAMASGAGAGAATQPQAEAEDPHAGHNHAPGMHGHGANGLGAGVGVSQEPLADLAGKVDLSPVRDLAVQDRGRRKPLDTFAREQLKLILGYERPFRTAAGKLRNGDGWDSVNPQGGRFLDPVHGLLSLLFEPDRWAGQEVIKINNLKLVELFAKKENVARLSLAEIEGNAAYAKELSKIDPDDKMTGPFANAVMELHHRRLYFLNLARTLKVTPVPGAPAGAAWSAVDELRGLSGEKRAVIEQSFSAARTAWRAGDAAGVNAALATFGKAVRDAQGEASPPAWKLSMERAINVWHPLRLSYGVLLVSSLLLGAAVVTGGRKLYVSGIGTLAMGLVLSVGALTARTIIVERAPVSNLYEASTFGVVMALVCGTIFEVVYRNGVFGCAAAIFTALGSLLIDLAGMDATIQPLQPVLRSYWLNIHVTSMLVSYAIFAIGFVLGIWYFAKWFPAHGLSRLLLALPIGAASAGVGLLFYRYAQHEMPGLMDYLTALVLAPGAGIGATAALALLLTKGKVAYEDELELKAIERYIDRSTMVGLLVITIGIILGAVWANESWGRYWGWDPKETWAFITWMVYAVYVHGRIAGWFRGAKAAIFPVVGFYSVLFTFFGVSFVLPGLHSYLSK